MIFAISIGIRTSIKTSRITKNGANTDCFLYSRTDRKSVLFIFSVYLLILPVLFSCTQKSNLEIATGKVTTIKLGNVVRIKEINVLTSTDDGTFANMAGTAAEAMTPGIIGMGTSKLASATGSIVDGRVEAVKMIRVRVKLKDTNELVEVQQEVTPNFTLKIGQEVVITQGSTPGNVWPD